MTAHKFRIAFCILCHKYTPVLEELIRILNVPGNEIFIHVDGKSRIQDFAPLRDRTGVHFLEPRTKVYWAGFSMVESTLRLFAETQNKNFHYNKRENKYILRILKMIQTNIIEETIKKIKGIMESDYSFNFPNHSLIMDFRLKVNGQNLVLSINEINVDFDLFIITTSRVHSSSIIT